MTNASPLEWTWTIAYLLALLFSGLYMWRLFQREIRRRLDKTNGLLRWWAIWQFVITAFFLGTELLAIGLGIVRMLVPAPTTEELSAVANWTARGFIAHALITMGVQWFVWFADGKIARYVNAPRKEGE